MNNWNIVCKPQAVNPSEQEAFEASIYLMSHLLQISRMIFHCTMQLIINSKFYKELRGRRICTIQHLNNTNLSDILGNCLRNNNLSGKTCQSAQFIPL